MSWTITGTQKVAPDPYFYTNTVLLLHGNGTNGSASIIDSSPSPKTVTAFGNAQISTAQSKFGGASILFNGTGDYLLTGYNSGAFDFGSGNWTIEFWIYLPSFANNYRRIYSYMNSNTESCLFEITDTNKMSVGIASGGSVVVITDPSVMTTGTWTHFAGVRNASSLLLFSGGVQVGSANVGTNAANGGVGFELFIGRWKVGIPQRDFFGYIDELRITKGIARYTAAFTPPTAPFPDI